MREASEFSFLDGEVAERFASEWQAAWNAHNAERVLQHFHEGVEFRSPVARRVLAETDGVLRGKDATFPENGKC